MAMRYQPQGLLRVSQSNGLAGLLAASVVPPHYQSAVLNRPVVPGSGVSRVVTGEGVAFQHSASNGGVAFGLTGGLDTLVRPGQAFSVFLRVFVSTLGTRQAIFADHNSGGDLDSIKLEITAANQWLFALNDGTSRTVSAAGVTLGWHDVLLVHTPGVGGAMYVDSLPPGVVSFTASLRNGVALRLGSFGTYTTLCFRGRTAVCHIFRGDVSEQYQSLRSNPWQVFDDPSDDDDLIAAVATAPNNYTLTAAPGTFDLAGSPASLRVTRKLAGGNGSFSLTGVAATLRAGRRIVGATGVITLAGGATALTVARKLVAEPGTFALAGSSASITVARRLAVAAGVFTLTGGDAQLVYSPAPEAAVIVTATGRFVLTGAAVSMRVTRRLQAQSGSFALTGSPVCIFIAGGKVDVSTISPARIVIFEGSGSRVVPFESSGSRVTPFGGSGSRVTPFQGSGSRTVRF